MTNVTQSAEPVAEALTTTATAPAKKVELIPLYLHLKQSEIQARLGQQAIDAARLLHERLKIHSPKSPAFKEVEDIMANVPILMADFMQLEEAIDVARKAANELLYGVKEPNMPVQEDAAKEVQVESGTSDDSTERASG